MRKKVLLGQCKYGEIIFAELNEDRTIRGFDGYYLYDSERTYDGENYLDNCSWTHSVEINGVTYKSGMKLAEDIVPFFEDDDVKQIMLDEDYYTDHGMTCSECGTFHSTEQYGNVSYTILNECELYCKTCVGADDLIAETPVHDMDDIYNAKDVVGLSPENFEEVKTIFHDCGWGGPATNHEGAKQIVNELLDKYGELYAGLTGIGQFQVYVTLYKKVS